MLHLVRFFSNRKISRILAKRLGHYDVSSGERRIEKVLKRYIGEKTDFDTTCRIYYPFVKNAIAYGAQRFDIDQEKMKEFFKDPIKRKGLGNVVLSISDYGVTKPQNLSAPFLVVWDITKACNLKCRHCYSSSGTKSPNELNTREVKKIIDDLDRMGVVALAFSGGEPLMRKDFFEIASYTARKNIYVAVASNGTLITESIAKKLKHAGVRYVEVSLDGIRPETHDRFRGVKGAWEKTVNGIKNCQGQGLMTAIATTATRSNYDEIENIIDFAEKLGVDRFIEFNFIPTGRGRFAAAEDLTPEQREKMLRMLYRRSKTSNIEIFSTAPQYARLAVESIINHTGEEISFTFYGGHMKGKTLELAEFISGCGAGRLYCAISSSGKVRPCVFMPIVVGDLKKDRFSDIWKNAPVFRSLRTRKDAKGRCASCTYRYVCGGCRSRAYGYYGDIYEVDPGCIYNKEEFEKICEKE